MTIDFEVLGAPRGKGRPRFTKEGHTYTDSNTVSYENLVAWCYRSAARGYQFEGPVSMKITVLHPVPKSDTKKKREEKLSGLFPAIHKPDADNVAKIICDALNGLAYRDDTQVTELIVTKRYAPCGAVLVRMEDAECSSQSL